MIIRREQPNDADAIDTIHRRAFGGEAEPRLAAELRAGGHALAALSLVAEIDGIVVAHVVTSRGHVTNPDGTQAAALGLGPIGVLPEHQGNNIGSALMHASIAAADALDEPLIALLGNPDFYNKFGFVRSCDVGIEPPHAQWGEFFQVRTLTAFNSALAGTFAYAPPFDDA